MKEIVIGLILAVQCIFIYEIYHIKHEQLQDKKRINKLENNFRNMEGVINEVCI